MTTLRSLSLLVPLFAEAVVPSAVRAESNIDFNRDIRPILSNKCFACHGPDEGKLQAGLRLDDSAIARSELESGGTAIVPGKPNESELIVRATHRDESLRMPPAEFGKPLSEDELATLSSWIEQGAPYAVHWSYAPPQRRDPPDPPDAWSYWPINAIDRFALQAMVREGLRPSPQADRTTLVRRLYLDLTGLPPSLEEVDSFVYDNDPQAYSRLVDSLLARPTFGEHWARQWLDLARYADSAGYADDPPRTIWAYRDWVIKAFNDDMPFDRFTIEQIAGDLLPDPTDEQLLATAFHRNTLTNNEGGTQDEEFRNVAVVDRVNTTMAVWMGTTMACAQCHSHKYDPISQEEYFQLFAILNNTQDADVRDESPLLSIYSPEQQSERKEWMERIAAYETILTAAADARDAPANASLDAVRQDLAAAEASLAKIEPVTTAPILREIDGAPRETRLQYRGNYLDKGPKVTRGLPSAFPHAESNRPLDRLSLARWLVDENNPLTARVCANRLWEALFGRGIVLTSEEFGSQGELPTHPELLDWLATEFMASGWNVKQLIRTMVVSAVYRQSSQVVEDSAALDPDNRWLSRGPRVRLSAEMVRDQALAASGLLSNAMYGPPVRPPQPNLGLSAAFGGSTDWETSDGSDRYRRAIYTTWRRSNPYPSMATFDAPNREVCTVRRNRTNTPLQSLVTLNDPVYVEAAQALARRAHARGGSPDEQIACALRCCLSREPGADEMATLRALYHDVRKRMLDDRGAALELATQPLGPLPAGMDAVDAAALTVVANVLLNLDEIFLKR